MNEIKEFKVVMKAVKYQKWNSDNKQKKCCQGPSSPSPIKLQISEHSTKLQNPQNSTNYYLGWDSNQIKINKISSLAFLFLFF